MITVEILKEIETLLRTALNKNEDFVLADYFDYISGTSTGAIIAACLSLGWPVDTIRKFYINSGAKMFDKASFLKKLKVTTHPMFHELYLPMQFEWRLMGYNPCWP